MDRVELHALKLGMMLLSREDWSKQYLKAPQQHAKMLLQTAKLKIVLTKFFRDMAKQSRSFVNWNQYAPNATPSYRVDVTVNDEAINMSADMFIKVTLKTVTDLTAIGAAASETTYKVPLGITSTEEAIQNLGVEHVAKLVGKKVIYNPDKTISRIIDNPNPEYNVLNTVRKDIAASVKRSLAVGKTTDEAAADVDSIIKNPRRSMIIARTESVNAYQAGVTEFGRQSGAVGKIWLTAGATDICADYAAEGPVPFDYLYGGYLMGPTAHVLCKCARRLIYQAEWDRLQNK